MALQSSGAISLSDLQTEFGGSNPISLSEYYQNASPDLVTANNTNVPNTGNSIDLSDFYGATLAQTVTYEIIGGGGEGAAAAAADHHHHAAGDRAPQTQPVGYKWRAPIRKSLKFYRGAYVREIWADTSNLCFWWHELKSVVDGKVPDRFESGSLSLL